MAQTIVTVRLNGQPYQMQCGEDEVGRIEQLAQEIDGLMQQLKPDAGHVPDVRLLAIISIMMAERAQETEKMLTSLREELAELRAQPSPEPASAPQPDSEVNAEQIASHIEQAALRINEITAKLAQ